jgi:hypothetical protein
MLASIVGGLAFLALAVLVPALAVHRVLRLPIEASLVLPLGWAAAAGCYWLSLVTGWPWLFPALLLMALGALALPLGRWRAADGPALSGAVPPFLALLGLLSATQYGWNRHGTQGEFVLDPLVPYDTGFHVGLARELTLGYPPQVPGIAGFTLSYHLGADLVRAAALRWAGADPYDSVTRLDPTLGALALVLLLRAVAARLGFPPRAVALVPWTLLATDLSFAFAANPQAHWWADLLRGNLLLSVCLANPVIPALALALAALVALDRALAGEGRAWLVAAALLALALPAFKVFLGAHFVLGLGSALVVAHPRARMGLLMTVAPATIATLLLALGPGARSVEVSLAPLDLVDTTRTSLGLAPSGGPRLALWVLLWILASLGLRVLALGPALRALFSRRPLGIVLAAMGLAAWPLGLLFRVASPVPFEGQRGVNDAAYFLEQGGALLWIFAVPVVVALADRWGRAAVLALAAALSLPSTLQFIWQKQVWPNEAIPAPMVRAARAVAAAGDPGDVVLQRPAARFPPAPVLLTSRRVPFERFTPWLAQFAPALELAARHERVHRFFRTRERGEALGIARELNARFVCLYGGERLRFDPAPALPLIYEEPEARCYRVPDGSGPGSDQDDLGMQDRLDPGSLGRQLEAPRHGDGNESSRLVQHAEARWRPLRKASDDQSSSEVATVAHGGQSRRPDDHRRNVR